MKSKIAEKLLDNNSVFFIAEIGKNFIDREGEMTVKEALEKAKNLVFAAKNAGADAVKFQTHTVFDEVANLDFKSPHFDSMDRYQWVEKNEMLTPLDEFFIPLKAYCDALEITFFSTPMSRGAAKKLAVLDMPFWKLGSADITDFVMGEYISKTGKPVIISTGMVDYDELDIVVKFFENKNIELVILYCVSEYPCPPDQFNLNSISFLKEKYPKHVIGFSDHSVDSYLPVLGAVELGASVIEKHFSFSRDLWGSDHKASLTPHEFKDMVVNVIQGNIPHHELGLMKGDLNKELPGAQNRYRPFFEKSLVASRDLVKGQVLVEEDFWAMRPHNLLGGFSAKEFPSLLGKLLTKDVKEGEAIKDSDV